MHTPTVSGRWRHYATLRANGHVATVTRRVPTDECAIPLYLVALNGMMRRALPDWREAMAYASNLVSMRLQNPTN